MRTKKVNLKVISCFLVCVCLLCVFHVDVHAQTADIQQSDTSEEYVTARVVIGNTSRALGDPNADVEGDGVRLRSGPSQDYAVLELMYNGEYVSIDFTTSYKHSNGAWYYVKRIKTGRWGWVKADNIYYWD